jgi:ribosome modulation factor
MNARDVPACMRIPVDEARAYEHGYGFGNAGLSRDTNPHFPHGETRRLAVAWDEGWCDGLEVLP